LSEVATFCRLTFPTHDAADANDNVSSQIEFVSTYVRTCIGSRRTS